MFQQTMLIDIYNEILMNIIEKKITCSIFLDLAKAFDSLNHRYIIEKIRKIWNKRPSTQFNSKLSHKQKAIHYCK